MRAVKGNREYHIEEAQKKLYQDAGFDIVGEDGEMIAYGRGKTVPYEEYKALEERCEVLQRNYTELMAAYETLHKTHIAADTTAEASQEEKTESLKPGRKKAGA